MAIFEYDKPNFTDYALISAPIRVDESLPSTDLTVAGALEKIPEQDRASYSALYKWFEENSGTIGSRMLGERLPGVEFPHSAQRGIHTPSKRKYAASVTLTKKSLYGDGAFADLGDGTWVLHYCEHRNNTNGTKSPTWNQPLINCLVDGVPVGVFVQEGRSGQSYLRALAFVEEYDPDSGMFVLHGPVTPETESIFESHEPSASLPSAEELKRDTRIIKNRTQVVRVGQQKFRSELMAAYGGRCAISNYGVDPVLQAAHILEYRGTPSNNVRNGLLLRSDIHILFDRGLIGIDPSDFRVVVGSKIGDSPYCEFDGKPLQLPKDANARPNEDYIAASFKKFSETQLAS